MTERTKSSRPPSHFPHATSRRVCEHGVESTYEMVGPIHTEKGVIYQVTESHCMRCVNLGTGMIWTDESVYVPCADPHVFPTQEPFPQPQIRPLTGK